VKNSETSKSAAIRYESELVAHFRDFVSEDPDLHWILATETLSPEGTRSDLLNLKFDGTNFSFRPYYALKPSLAWLENLPVHASSLRPLVVTPELSPRVLATCKEREIAAIDLNGRAWLRAPGLLVDRRSLPGRSFSYELEPRNIFFGKSVRIVRCLLSDRDHIWTQSEIVPRVNASTGLVSRIVQHLVSQGFLEKLSAREYRLRDWKALLDEWAQADRLHTRTRTTAYAGFLGPAQELAPRVQQWAKAEKVPSPSPSGQRRGYVIPTPSLQSAPHTLLGCRMPLPWNSLACARLPKEESFGSMYQKTRAFSLRLSNAAISRSSRMPRSTLTFNDWASVGRRLLQHF